MTDLLDYRRHLLGGRHLARASDSIEARLRADTLARLHGAIVALATNAESDVHARPGTAFRSRLADIDPTGLPMDARQALQAIVRELRGKYA